MNKIDKEIRKALNFFVDCDREKINEFKKKGFKTYDTFVSKRIEKFLEKNSFINLKGNSELIITLKGLHELRNLEIKWYQYLTVIISIIALFISLLALSNSLS